MLLNFNGKYLKTQKHVEEQGEKALFANSNTLRKKPNALFYTNFHTILSYACEVCGSHKASDIEKVQLRFCKNKVLNVNKRANNNFTVTAKTLKGDHGYDI